MRTLCDFICINNVTVDTNNDSNIYACNFVEVIGCDFT